MVELQRKKSWQEKGAGWGWWRGFLMLECPKGHRNRVGLHKDGHSVAADGAVSPSLVCPGDAGPCDWHEYGRFVGWQGDESAKDEVGP